MDVELGYDMISTSVLLPALDFCPHYMTANQLLLSDMHILLSYIEIFYIPSAESGLLIFQPQPSSRNQPSSILQNLKDSLWIIRFRNLSQPA